MNDRNKIFKINSGVSTQGNETSLDVYKTMNNILKTNLTKAKSEINNNKMWDISKKHINEYELISLYNNSKINPISRSYYKLIEILTDFDMHKILKLCSSVKCACICEGPGGFVQALNHYMQQNDITYNPIPCISLISYDRRIPKWKLDSYKLKYRLCYGEDKTGDLYKKKNIHHFVEDVGEFSCDFVTADGGFDFSINFNSQEQLFQRLLFSEVYTILKLQKNQGTCVIKVFDLFDETTISLISILSYCYRDVYLCKPFSSRPANSEKYLICEGYTVNKVILDSLETIFDKNLSNINQICDKTLYNIIFQSITEYNKVFVINQIQYINRTIEYSHFDNSITNKKDIYKNHEHANLCTEWVNRYLLPNVI
tara:strand:- start:13151 stop:14260 length:1110 start_codon:yes stop_codon:yes gene_type:complete